MQTASDLEREFLPYAVEQTHPFARDCAGDGLRNNLLLALRRDIERISSSEFAQWHSHGRAFFGVPAAGFNNRLMDIGPIRLIAGIRFRNRDTSHPFVSVERSSIPLGTLADGTALMAELFAAFAPFKPRAMSFDHPAHLPLRIGGKADYHVLVAAAQSMIARPTPPGFDRVALVPCTDLDFYDRYVALYDDIHNERPWARNEVTPEDRGSLEDCLAQGLLLHIEVDGAWYGIVAGTHSMREAISGIQVAEIILSRSARGRGVGVAVQRRFAEQVAMREPAAIIWGTIAHANVPMRRTAERAGRMDIGATYCVDF
jgi:hypothetical protein